MSGYSSNSRRSMPVRSLTRLNQGPGLRPGVGRDQLALRRGWTSLSCWYRRPAGVLVSLAPEARLPLALLVARVRTDDHDPAMPADHPALVADPLDARLDLHWLLIRS